jgi:malate dehydrogenase (oxaloacetate-decarboxylating)(NADP+)
MKALRYHARRPTGKTQITATKPCDTATDLALAYTPGVATPCRAIHRHPDSVYRYTNKGTSSRSCRMGLPCSDWEIWDPWLPSR